MAPGEREGEPAASPPRRINVAVIPDMLAAIDRVMDREQVTLTEAVRRLIGYGDFLYRTVKQDGQTIIVRGDDGGNAVSSSSEGGRSAAATDVG